MEHLKHSIETLAAEYVRQIFAINGGNQEEHWDVQWIKDTMESRCGEENTRNHIQNAFNVWKMITGESPPLNNISVFNLIYGK